MSTVWCDVLLVQMGNSRGAATPIFYAVPFSTGGLTVKRVLAIEEAYKQNIGYSEVLNRCLSSELLNEMQLDEKYVERIIERDEMVEIQARYEKGE